VDKDHGHVSLKWIKLAQKLAKEQGKSMRQDAIAATSSTQLVGWKDEAEDKMHGTVPAWQVALMKKARAERQEDDEQLNKPLAEAMQKEGYIYDTHSHTPDKMKELAVDHTKLEDPKRLANLAIKAQKERDDDAKEIEKPLAQQMVKDGYLKDPHAAARLAAKERKIAMDSTQLYPKKLDAYVKEVKAAEDDRKEDFAQKQEPLYQHMKKEGFVKKPKADKFAAVAKDVTQLHPNQAVNYVKEANEAEADRDADDQKYEKPLADEMTKQGFMEQKGFLTVQQKRMRELAIDHMQMHPKKLDAYVKEVRTAEGDRKEDFAKKEEPLYQQMKREGFVKEPMATKFVGVAKDTTVLHHKQGMDDYLAEAAKAKEDRDADSRKLEKPLAHEMVRQGYVYNEKRAASMQDRAVDKTNMKTIDIEEVSGLAGKAKFHLYSNRKGPSHGSKLTPRPAHDYVKEAKEAMADRDADTEKEQRPLANELVRQGYLHARQSHGRARC